MQETIDGQDTPKKMNTWLTIWVKPKETIRYAIEHKTLLMAFLIVSIAGIGNGLDAAFGNSPGEVIPTWAILLLCVLGGPIYGLITLYVTSGIYYLVGKWFGGKGTMRDMQMAVSWSMIPLIWTMLVWVIDFSLFGTSVFKEEFANDVGVGGWIIFFIGKLLEVTASVWAIVISIFGIAEAHKLSGGKAFLTWFLPGLVIGGVIVLVVIFIVVATVGASQL